jgi:uncharacterized protein
MTTSSNHPVFAKDRVIALDLLRGFAILGILVMNIQSFSMPDAAYLNPKAYGDLSGFNRWVWMLSHIFADQKFMTLFSLLFGAGVVLFSENVEKRQGKSAALYYRRVFWLLIIGLFHAHFIWHGDILVAYALCGFLVYLLRKKTPGFLLVFGLILVSLHTVIYTFFGWSLSFWTKEALLETKESWKPSIEVIKNEILAYTGSFSEQQAKRSESAFFLETFVFLTTFLWRAGGLMLVGMAFYKWKILSAERSKAFYQQGLVISWTVGLPLITYGIIANFDHNWTMEYSMFYGSQFNYWGSLFMAFGYICLVMLWVKTQLFESFKMRLAAVGRMALSNYIMQSLIGVFIFYGMGLSLFGRLDRLEQLGIVLLIWIFQLLWSRPWLENYNYGPFEWLWRSLTYKQKQPFKIKSTN